MADYEFLEPRGLDLASSRTPVGPPKPPRLHSAGDLCDVPRRGTPPHISVTAPPEPVWYEDRRVGPPPPADTVDRLKLAGSFDSLDSETMVSVGEMADLDTLLADLQNSIGYGQPSSSHSSPARPRKAVTLQRDASPSRYTEVVSETKRTVRREETPPPAEQTSGGMRQLDALLHDLNEARYNTLGSQGKESPSPPVSNMVAVQPASHDELDIIPSPNAKTFETRTVTVTESVPEGCHNTSSATQELDDLMASLSDFKIHATSYQRTVVEETHDPPLEQPAKTSQLDTMLGNLQDDMDRQGVNTAVKGTCAACGQPIVGQVITALGKTWHPEHFTCSHCNMELGNKNFFERDGQPFCEHDYHQLFSPRCSYCRGPILDKCVTALGQTWHPEHFFCAQCGQPFGDAGFHERDGKAYCRQDYFDMFAPRCAGCGQPVMENYISALNAQWHSECFVCTDCKQTFANGSFFDYEGQPYCETHYHAKRGSLCAGCHKPITGRCVTAMFKKFHPEHFNCSFCLKQLNKGTFKEQDDKPYCHQCFDKLFG
ncbi:paxillin-like isoform X1 [Amphibalanus amphitrite]|uniref:paxillin-like isoform X1 n=1 Tax=Amphibalanus amphitrite TaxID=1232801 RepID=UPI001C913208|nr:paxillin-like isoform X1 [Amphibalanus amphitrite]